MVLSMPAISHLDWMKTGRLAPYATSHALAGGVIGMVEAAQPAGDMSDPPISDLVLARGMYRPIRQTSDFGVGRFSNTSPPDAFFLLPPHVASHIMVDDDHVIRCFSLPARCCEEALGSGVWSALERLHTGDFRSQLLVALTDTLWSLGASGAPTARLLAEGAMLTMLGELSRLATPSSKRDAGPPRPDWRLRGALEYLEAHLADDVGLAELASVMRISTTHAGSLFRAGTGEPPHRWLMRRRVERACELLCDPRRSVTEVALACGFASSQHLATVFRKRLGVTPTAWRRRRLS